MTEIQISGFVPGALGRIVELHGRYYARHWKLGPRFEAEVARELAEFLGRFDAVRDGLWVALRGEDVLGSIVIDGGITPQEGARLRWFILDEACQGQGIGKRLMGAAMDFCAQAGFPRVYLWTFRGLDAARRLYDAWGFAVTESYEDTAWGDRVLHQRLDKPLRPAGAERP